MSEPFMPTVTMPLLAAARPVEGQGWIGHWSPGIGDPCVMGWINKQRDLQSAFTEVMRVVAREQGWYEARRQYQRLHRGGGRARGLSGHRADRCRLATWMLPQEAFRRESWTALGTSTATNHSAG